MYVNGACAAVILVSPDPRQQDLPGKHLAGVLGEKLQEFVFHVREVEWTALDRGLVGVDVQRQPAVLDRFVLHLGEALEQQMAQAGLDLRRMERGQAEVVEQVVAQLQLVELRPVEQQQQPGRRVALAQRPAERPGTLGVRVAGHDRAGPPVGRFVGRRAVGGANRLPPIATQIQGARQIRRRRLGVDDQLLQHHRYKTRRYRSCSKALTCVLYARHSLRLLRRNHSKMCSPRASCTSDDCSMTRSESLSDCGSRSMPSLASSVSLISNRLLSASGGSSYPSVMPRIPAASITAKARYGLHAGSGERNSIRVALRLPRLATGTHTRPLRLLRAHVTCTGASNPGTSRL